MPEAIREFVCPITGEVIPEADIDALIDALERVKAQEGDLRQFRMLLGQFFVERTNDFDARTRRIRGNRRRCKIELADESWDQKTLKQAWTEFPELAKQYMAIESVKLQMKEWKKALK